MRVLISLLLTLLLVPVQADTLARIAKTGEFRIGFVPDAPPLSFVDANGDASGYSIELCQHVANAVQRELELTQMDITYTPLVTMSERLDAIQQGQVDIECGATTVTLSRRELVDFTLMTFITGVAVLSRKEDAINTVDDVAGATVAVLPGTTTEAVIQKVIEINEFEVEVVLINSHDEGMALLNAGKVTGYASDRAMLIGQVFRNDNAKNEYALTRAAMSFEPYALMIPRGDTRFRLVADKALATLYRSARIRRIHQNWFGRYGEPLSPIVEAMYQFQAVGE